MPFLIDGHNLIPKLGLSLDDPDDEAELVRLLQDFARIRRQPVEVYFDGAPAGQAGARKLGSVKAHFVRQGDTADAAIHRRLETLGKAARNWVVVSSDNEVKQSARTHRAGNLTSEEFVKLLRAALASATPAINDTERAVTSKEVDEWLKIFGGKE